MEYDFWNVNECKGRERASLCVDWPVPALITKKLSI
jgi:hypothetical protein